MQKFVLVCLVRLFSLCSLFLFGPAFAGQWKPLCIEGSSCNAPYQVGLGGGTQGYHPIDRHAAGPLVTNEGILLHHTPLEFPIFDASTIPVRHIFQLAASGLENFGDRFYVSDANAVQSPTGRMLSFFLGAAVAWFTPDEDTEVIDWFGRNVLFLNLAELIGPPVIVDNVMYTGIRGGGGSSVYMSTDDGNTWVQNVADIRIGEDRFNLLENPDKNALWAINSEFFDLPGSLWESTDHGSTWWQVDDGSFPPDTVRVIHDPDNSLVSYALTSYGLFVSVNRGISWQATSLIDEPVHGMVFVERMIGLSRALIVGTDTGVKVSVDEAESWLDMSAGLLAIPHTVTYGHGMLIATSDAGYFTCHAVDCAGLSQLMAPEEEGGIVDVIEFYNTDLDHYFITASQADINFIDQGFAGKGWVHTGESFLAWSVGSNVEAANVCRFYGSLKPGPNSHFFSLSTQDCRFLMELQETGPSTKPRWNFEAYVFSLMPPFRDQHQPCRDTFTPVYRAYNNGFTRGKDSNHRYVTNLGLLAQMIAQGWSNEGVVFCSPAERGE